MMKAVVMAGGFGTRIQPLTNSIPKPMLPILNRPMMEYIIKKLKDVGITDIVVLLYFKPEVIKDYFKDGKDFGVNITYVLPDDDYGTAGAVKKAEKYLDERFIVVSGDLVTDFDFKEIIGFHEIKQSKLTITLTSVSDPLQFGVVITDKEGKILRFLEKPGWGEVFSDTINTGIYIIEPEILKYIPDNIPFDFSKDLFPKLMKEGITLYGYNAKGYWRDVGNPESYREVIKDILSGKVKIEIYGEKIQKDGYTLYKQGNINLSKNVKLEGIIVLDDNVEIKENCYLKNVVIGKNCKIDESSILEDTVLWNNVNIGKNCEIKNGVLCDNVSIGNNVKAEHGVIIAENTIVKDDVKFERDVIIWPDKLIEEKSIISSNLIWGEKYKAGLFEGGKVSGRTNIELSCEMVAKLAESFGSIIPKGKTIIVGRDYHRASRMLKRAFLGGLLGTGVNVLDLKLSSLPVLRYILSNSDNVAGVYFRQSPENPASTDILFFDNDGLPIDTNTEKTVERIFFRENFRRAAYNEIGEIKEDPSLPKSYKDRFLSLIQKETIQSSKIKIIADLLNGSTYTIYPDIINNLNIDNILINAYQDERKLSQVSILKQKSISEISKIVSALKLSAGFVIYPSGEKLTIISEKGEILPNYKSVLIFLYLINKTANKQLKIYLPVYIPDILDNFLDNLIIERGKTIGLKASFLKDYYFFANLEGNYAFTEFSYSFDGMFASVKLLEMLSKANLTISECLNVLPDFYFNHTLVACPSYLKGKMMRKFSEEAIDKNASFVDGVKIFFDNKNWILMIPDQYADSLHIYIQAENRDKGEEILNQYLEKINNWILEE